MKKNKLYYIIIPLCFLVFSAFIYVFFLHQPDSYLLRNNPLKIDSFQDDNDGGKSEVLKLTKSQDSIFFNYKLKNKGVTYAGFDIFPDTLLRESFKNYNEVSIAYKIKNISAFNLVFRTFEYGITNVNDPNSYRFNHVLLLPEKENYLASNSFSFSDFKIMGWWLKYNASKKELNNQPNWSAIETIRISHGELTDKNKPGTICIYGLRLSKNNSGFFFVSSLLILFYYLFVVLFFKKFKRKKVAIVYQAVKEPNFEQRDDWKSNVINYIAQNYSNDTFTLKKLAKELGKPEKDISKFISENYEMSFKQYLNNIRLEEASRLLKNPKYSIKEIAYLTGFSSQNSFSRVFKQYNGISPTEFKNNA